MPGALLDARMREHFLAGFAARAAAPGVRTLAEAAAADASAARASTGANSRSPPEALPCPPGNCTECVASNTTGYPVRAMMGRDRKSVTSML